MVFRNGGYLRKNEKWFYNGEKMEVVPYFKYLGLMISSRLMWSMAQRTLASQASKGVSLIKHIARSCGGLDTHTYFNLFDKMIMPILTYGAEIWGFETKECIERVHTKFLKYVLGVPTSATNAAVYGECGRLPVKVTAILKLIKYWLKVLEMPSNRLPKNVYLMTYELTEAGRLTWASKVKNVLFLYGFGEVWISQELGNTNVFLALFSQRLTDSAHQNWNSEVNERSTLRMYKDFKTSMVTETYLESINSYNLKRALSNFRCGVYICKLKYQLKLPRAREDSERLVCKHCSFNATNREYVLDEYHMVILCPLFNDLREKYIPKWVQRNPCYDKFVELMRSQNITVLYELSLFVYLCMKGYDELVGYRHDKR